jgi:hypothetical protein
MPSRSESDVVEAAPIGDQSASDCETFDGAM